MLTTRLHKNNFINNKKKIVYLEDAYKKLIFIILILLLTIFFLLPKINVNFTDSKFNFFNEKSRTFEDTDYVKNKEK